MLDAVQPLVNLFDLLLSYHLGIIQADLLPAPLLECHRVNLRLLFLLFNGGCALFLLPVSQGDGFLNQDTLLF